MQVHWPSQLTSGEMALGLSLMPCWGHTTVGEMLTATLAELQCRILESLVSFQVFSWVCSRNALQGQVRDTRCERGLEGNEVLV